MEATQIQNHFKLSLTTILLGLLVVLFVCNTPHSFAQTNQTSLKLQDAQEAFEQAFNAALDAESSKANITILLNQLNDVANLLSQAENAHQTGNINQALIHADNVIQLSKQISLNAQTLKEVAIIENKNAFQIKIASAIIGSVLFVLVMYFIVWRQFNRRYLQKKLNTHPENT